MTNIIDDSRRINILRNAFKNYIRGHDHIDVVECKRGLIFLIQDGDEIDASYIKRASHLFDFLLDSISCDVRDLFLEGQHDDVFLHPKEIEECRKRLLPFLHAMPDEERIFFTAQADFYFKHCNDSYFRR